MICRHYTPMVRKRKQKTGRDAAAASESALVSDGKDLGGQSVRQVHQGTVESAGVVEEGVRQLIGYLLQRQGAGEAAALSGFADYSAFYKACVKETGQPPRKGIYKSMSRNG